jgi:hypothetical protein
MPRDTQKISPLIRYRHCRISTIQDWGFERDVIENSRIAKRETLFDIVKVVLKLS